MKVLRFDTPRAFLDRTEAFLLADEAAHNLLLGMPARLAARGPAGILVPPADFAAGQHDINAVGPAQDVYLAAVIDGEDVVAAAMTTPPWRLVLSQTRHVEAAVLVAEDAAARRPLPPGVQAPDPIAGEFVAGWQRLTGERAERTHHERIHRLDHVRPVPSAPGHLRAATEADRPLLVAWLRDFQVEAFGEHAPPVGAERLVDGRLASATDGLVLWDDAGPRCVAGFAAPTPNGIRVGPVYTPPAYRERGYATACVAGLSRTLLDRGYRFCCLYTDLANPTSNRIYRRIGYEPVCDVADYRFLRSTTAP